MVRYGPEDLASGRLCWTERTPPEWLEREAFLAQQQRMTGRLQPLEKEYFRKDGARVGVKTSTGIITCDTDNEFRIVLPDGTLKYIQQREPSDFR
jgi:hypothetical protein